MFKRLVLFALLFLPHHAESTPPNSSFNKTPTKKDFSPQYYAKNAREFYVEFTADYLSPYKSQAQIDYLNQAERNWVRDNMIAKTTKYVFGPLAQQELGGPLRVTRIDVDWANAKLRSGRMAIPYTYHGQWSIHNDYSQSNTFEIPVPLNEKIIFSNGWTKCSDPDYPSMNLFFYFWNPYRADCDHIQGQHYDVVKVKLSAPTRLTLSTYPEYERLFRTSTDGLAELRLTMAFGYVHTEENANPDTSQDEGMVEYRKFLNKIRYLVGTHFSERNITRAEYMPGASRVQVIGRKFEGYRHGRRVIINVVTSSGVDQMYLFAQSFAHDRDSVFAWFGHSRVGTGFEVARFSSILRSAPHYYKISPDYQIVYWGGCNSYSYYTLPFFSLKAALSPATDPNGTKNLDIVAHILSSYFTLNTGNAYAFFEPLFLWEKNTSYQTIVNAIEGTAPGYGPIAVVLGDEDN